MTLDDKVRQAVKLLQVFGKGKVVEVSYSGGKDSDVILELAKMAGIEFRCAYVSLMARKSRSKSSVPTLRTSSRNTSALLKPAYKVRWTKL